MGPIGVQEMIGIFLIALLLFGPKKLPELGRLLGKGLSEFRRAKNELKNTFETHLQELEREARLSEHQQPKQLPSYTPPSSSSSYPYSYVEAEASELPEVTHSVASPYVPDFAAPHENGGSQSNGTTQLNGTTLNGTAVAAGSAPVNGTVPRGSGAPSASSSNGMQHPESASSDEGHSA